MGGRELDNLIKGNRPLAVSACWRPGGKEQLQSIRHLGPRRKGAGWVFAPDLTTQFCGAMLEAQALDRTISKHAGPKTTACSCVARARPGTELTRGTNEEQIVGTPMHARPGVVAARVRMCIKIILRTYE